MAAKAMAARSNPERLAYWYLRLNGFFVLDNFVIHPDTGSDQRTDVDLFGVRFRDRAELLLNPMKDDPRWTPSKTYVSVVIAEVKRAECELNGPWTKPAHQNMHRVLRAIGAFPEAKVDAAAKALYENGLFTDEQCTCRLVAMGAKMGKLTIDAVPQVLFRDMLQFVHARFQQYERQKANVGQWSQDGQDLARSARGMSLRSFMTWAHGYFNLR